MSKLKRLNAEKTKFSVIYKVISALSACMLVHADEVTDTTPTVEVTPNNPQINYEQLIAQARKEEKDKLYPRIKQLEEDNRKHIQLNNDNLIKIGDLTQTVNNLSAELAKYKSGETETQEVTDLKAKVATLEAENAQLKENAPNEEKIRAEIEKEYSLKSYIAEQKAAHKDEIISSFLDKIQGSTKEEVDASIQSAISDSLSIKKELGLVDNDGNPVNTSKKSNGGEKKKSAPAKQPKTLNPTENTGNSPYQFDAEYIRNLDPNSDEYKEFRKSIGLK